MLLTLLALGAAPPAQTFSCAALRSGVTFTAAPGVPVTLRRMGAALRVAAPRQVQTVPLECLNDFTEVAVDDFNFDGVRDMAVPVSVGYSGVNVFSRVLFVEAGGALRASKVEVGNIAADASLRVLQSGVKDGPAFTMDTHCLTPDGQDFYLCREQTRSPQATAADEYDVRWFSPAGRVLLQRRWTPGTRGQQLSTLHVTAPRSFFHAQASAASRGRASVIQGDPVDVLELRGDWARASYTAPGGRVTLGWLRRADLR